MIKVIVDRAYAMVNLTATGFVTEADVATGATQLHAAIRSLGDRAGQHLTLYDLTDLNVAAASVLDHFAVFFTDPRYRAIWARRVAFVTPSPLVTRQMMRVRQDRPDMDVFAKRADAITWLLQAPDRTSRVA